jgi:hypothetical protein
MGARRTTSSFSPAYESRDVAVQSRHGALCNIYQPAVFMF